MLPTGVGGIPWSPELFESYTMMGMLVLKSMRFYFMYQVLMIQSPHLHPHESGLHEPRNQFEKPRSGHKIAGDIQN